MITGLRLLLLSFVAADRARARAASPPRASSSGSCASPASSEEVTSAPPPHQVLFLPTPVVAETSSASGSEDLVSACSSCPSLVSSSATSASDLATSGHQCSVGAAASHPSAPSVPAPAGPPGITASASVPDRGELLPPFVPRERLTYFSGPMPCPHPVGPTAYAQLKPAAGELVLYSCLHGGWYSTVYHIGSAVPLALWPLV